MTYYKPVVDLRPTTILKAFTLNSILLGIITALTIEVRTQLDRRKSETQKVITTAVISMFISFFAYLLCRYLFGLGEGMLASPPWKSFF
jgi:hypothetical protein